MRVENAQNIQFTSLGLIRAKVIIVFADPCHFLWIFLSINKVSLHTGKLEAFND